MSSKKEYITKRTINFHGSKYILLPAQWIKILGSPEEWLQEFDKKGKFIKIRPLK